MAKISETISIDAPLERVFDYVTHPENLLEIWPSMQEVSNVQRSPDGSHSFDWVYKMVGFRFKGHAETTHVEAGKRAVVKNESGIPSTFTWAYDGDENQCRVSLDVEYSIPGKLLEKLAEPLVRRINEHEARTMLQNLKVRMEMEAKKAA